MADYRIQPSTFQIGEVSPVAQSNPLTSLGQGIQGGFSMGLQARQQKRLEEQLRQEMEIQKREQLNKDIDAFGTAFDRLKKYPEPLKESWYKKAIYPLGQRIGLPVGPEYDAKFDDPMGDVVLSLFKMKKNKEIDNQEFIAGLQEAGYKLSQQGEEKTSEYIRDIVKQQTDMMKPSSTGEIQQQKREDRLNKDILMYSEALEKNPVVKELKKQDISLNQVSDLMSLVKSGNTVAFSDLGTKMARAMGEVGVLTESDIIRYVQSGRLDRKSADTLSRWVRGKPTDATLNEISQIANALSDSFESKIQPIYNTYVNRLSRNYGLTPEEAAYRLDVAYKPEKEKEGKNELPKVGEQFQGGTVKSIRKIK